MRHTQVSYALARAVGKMSFRGTFKQERHGLAITNGDVQRD
jgi:hypothetical protein